MLLFAVRQNRSQTLIEMIMTARCSFKHVELGVQFSLDKHCKVHDLGAAVAGVDKLKERRICHRTLEHQDVDLKMPGDIYVTSIMSSRMISQLLPLTMQQKARAVQIVGKRSPVPGQTGHMFVQPHEVIS